MPIDPFFNSRKKKKSLILEAKAMSILEANFWSGKIFSFVQFAVMGPNIAAVLGLGNLSFNPKLINCVFIIIFKCENRFIAVSRQ